MHTNSCSSFLSCSRLLLMLITAENQHVTYYVDSFTVQKKHVRCLRSCNGSPVRLKALAVGEQIITHCGLSITCVVFIQRQDLAVEGG